jgi:hypothetical protein
MHAKLETTSNKEQSTLGIPQQDVDALLSLPYSDTTLLRNLSFKNLQFAKRTLISLHKVLEEDLFHPRKDARKRIKIAYRLIMANLVACVYQRKELSVSGTSKSYLRKEYLGKRFLTKQLEKLCLPLIYSVVESYDIRKLIVINPKKQAETERYYANTFNIEDEQTLILPKTHPDIVKLRRINEALQNATFAFKSPITRIYSNNDVIQGGRIYCAFQRLPDRRARIRINTLLNGLPCVEVDLSCNHPAMLMALNGLQIPRDWYSYVASKANCSRNKVKFLVTRMIGAEDRSIDLRPSSAEKNGIPITDIPSICDREQIEHVIADEFPQINQYLCKGGIGVFLQNLEGEILLNAMDALVNQRILSLPVHDSLCVQYIFEKEAKDAIEKSWMDVLGVDFKPWIKVDYSDHLPSKP